MVCEYLFIYLFATLDGNSSIKIIAGECLGTQAVIQTRIPITFLDITISKGNSFDVSIPEKSNSFVYIWRGKGFIGAENQPAAIGQVCFVKSFC